jgi:putative mycofactocin binding protein MftB
MTQANDPRILDEGWRLSPSVALRPEPFGALAYHFGTRKLTFLKRRELVDVVSDLESHRDVRSALTSSRVPEAEWPGYLAALHVLADTDMIQRRVPADVPATPGEGELA